MVCWKVPNLVKIYDVFRHEDQNSMKIYVIMDFYENNLEYDMT